MTSPIGKIGSQQRVTRDAGSDGHEQVSRRLDPKVEKKVKDVAQMYERQFLGEMFKAMRSTVHETDKPSMAQDIYQSQRDEQYIDAWSEQGGIGFSKIIYEQVMEKFFGQTPQGSRLKGQGPVSITNASVASVSQVKNGVVTPIKPNSDLAKPAVAPLAVQAAPLNASAAGAAANTQTPSVIKPNEVSQTLASTAAAGERRTVENTEPMPAPTPAPKNDSRSLSERVAAGELFPSTATANPIANSSRPRAPQPDSKTELDSASVTNQETQTQTKNSDPGTLPTQTALQIEVRPSPTGAPAKIQAPWDATVIQATKLDGARTAVTLEHGQGLRSTLVFDGVLASGTAAGQKIPRGQAIATLNQDAKSFLWNLATRGLSESETE